VVGLLSNQTESQGAPLAAAVRRGLGEQGFVEGQNVEILYRWAGGFDRLPLLAADLVRRRVAVIVTPGGGTGAALAAKAVTTTIPIVFAVGSDPVEMGLVANLSRPDGNLTGSTRLVQELTSKQLELLHNVVPAVSSVGFLRDPRVPYAAAQVREVEHAAPVLGVRVIFAVANNPGETEGAFGVLVGQRIGALMVGPSIMFSNQRDQITALAARYAVPAIYASREYVDVGGLMSYGANGADADRLAGAYAGRILKGEKPANLPVQQAAKVELTINLKAAKALGLTIPVNLLGRADEVIE
jgi:putative ABC transport system substrate-binding protein